MTFTQFMDQVTTGVEALGVVVLVGGLLWSGGAAVLQLRRFGGHRAYQTLRRSIGGSLLLGLEILVVADLIKTVAVAPTLENVAVLGAIVAIRTFLSFSLQIEIDGVLPWRRRRTVPETSPVHDGGDASGPDLMTDTSGDAHGDERTRRRAGRPQE